MSMLYVSVMGNDGGSGSARDPFATLNRAVEAARRLGAGVERRIVVGGGRYDDVAVELDAHDSGLVIEAAEGEAPILTIGSRTMFSSMTGKSSCIFRALRTIP
jgi:hypothetical protein